MSYKVVTPGLISTMKNALDPFQVTLEWWQQQTTADNAGKVKETYVDSGETIAATVSETTFDETSTFSQPGHQVNFKISTFGPPIESPLTNVKPGDAFKYDNKFFYVVAIDDTGQLGLATTYYVHVIPGR